VRPSTPDDRAVGTTGRAGPVELRDELLPPGGREAVRGLFGLVVPALGGHLVRPRPSSKGVVLPVRGTLSSVEVNNTFYRLAEPSTFRAWAAQAPRGFTYALKVSQYGTHRQKLREPERWLPVFVERARLLGPTQGPNLVQLPPRWGLDVDRLEEFLHVATTVGGGATKLRWAVEFRDPSWLDERTYQVLRRHNAALCVHDLLPDHPWLLTADWAYTRFHGPAARGSTPGKNAGSGQNTRETMGRSDWRDRPKPCARGWTRAAMCTPTSTTTSGAPPSGTRRG
jgi:Protein of unknown function DUF72